MELLDTLLKNGALGVLSAILLFLVLKLLKLMQEANESNFKHQVEDTAAKLKVAMAMETLVSTVRTLGDQLKQSTGNCSSQVSATLSRINEFLAEQRGREQGLREVSERFPIPSEFKDEK